MISSVFVIIFSCDDTDTILSNTASIIVDYQLNLIRTDSGINKYSASISWDNYTNEDFDLLIKIYFTNYLI